MTSTNPIALTPLVSSCLVAYGYEDGIFAAQYHSGHVDYYKDVPASVVEAFRQAPSKGAFYVLEIKGRFTRERVTGRCQCGDVGLLGDLCDDCGTARYTALARS